MNLELKREVASLKSNLEAFKKIFLLKMALRDQYVVELIIKEIQKVYDDDNISIPFYTNVTFEEVLKGFNEEYENLKKTYNSEEEFKYIVDNLGSLIHPLQTAISYGELRDKKINLNKLFCDSWSSQKDFLNSDARFNTMRDALYSFLLINNHLALEYVLGDKDNLSLKIKKLLKSFDNRGGYRGAKDDKNLSYLLIDLLKYNCNSIIPLQNGYIDFNRALPVDFSSDNETNNILAPIGIVMKYLIDKDQDLAIDIVELMMKEDSYKEIFETYRKDTEIKVINDLIEGILLCGNKTDILERFLSIDNLELSDVLIDSIAKSLVKLRHSLKRNNKNVLDDEILNLTIKISNVIESRKDNLENFGELLRNKVVDEIVKQDDEMDAARNNFKNVICNLSDKVSYEFKEEYGTMKPNAKRLLEENTTVKELIKV